MTENIDIEAEEVIDYSQVSVQVLYRPVLRERIPNMGAVGTDGYKWWVEQIKRCMNGWIAPDGRFLTGYEYFYLNFVEVDRYDDQTGKYGWKSPLWRDNDHDIFNIIWFNRPRKNPDGTMYAGRNHVEAKARGIAWSTVTLLGIGMWTFVFNPELGIASAYPDEDNIFKEKEWFVTAWEKLHPFFKTWKGKPLDILNSSAEVFTVGENFKGSKVQIPRNSARFDVIGTDKTGIYKGTRQGLMMAVEAGKWKGNRLKNYIAENDASAHLGDAHFGMFLVGGTANSILNPDSAYKDLYYRPQTWNATRHFTPKTKVLPGYWDEFTGKSDTKKAFEYVQALRKEKEDDPIMYHQEKIENPLTPEECFLPQVHSIYDSETINAQIQFIDDNHLDSLWVKGKMVYQMDAEQQNLTGKVEFVEDPKGEWMVNLEGQPSPEYGNLYVSGIDDKYKSVDKSKKVANDASRNAMIVWRQPTMYSDIKSDMPVGVYLGQPGDLQDTYEEFYKGMLFWDITYNMYEYNADGFIQFMRNKKASGRLFHIGDNSLPGIKVTPKVWWELTSLGSKFIRDQRHRRITYKPLLEAMRIWGSNTNTDIGSALHLVFYILSLTENTVVTEVKLDSKPQATYIKLGDPYSKPLNSSQTRSGYFKLGQRAS